MAGFRGAASWRGKGEERMVRKEKRRNGLKKGNRGKKAGREEGMGRGGVEMMEKLILEKVYASIFGLILYESSHKKAVLSQANSVMPA